MLPLRPLLVLFWLLSGMATGESALAQAPGGKGKTGQSPEPAEQSTEDSAGDSAVEPTVESAEPSQPTPPSVPKPSVLKSPDSVLNPEKPNEPGRVYPPCTVEASESATAAAKGAFEAGNAAFNEADYERAITYWEDAYRRDCNAHAMLKNLARAYELNGNFQRAIDALEAYRSRSTSQAEESILQRRIDDLKRKLEDERLRRELAEEAARRQRPVVNPEPLVFEDGELEFDDGQRSAFPLVLAGLGAGIGLVGGVQGALAASDLNDVERQCPNRTCPNVRIEEDGNDARERIMLWGYGFGGGGAVIMTAGLMWYFLQSPGTGAALTPQLGPRFAGLSYEGSF